MAKRSRRSIGAFKKDFFYKDVKVLSVHIDEPFCDPLLNCAGIRRIERFYRSIFASFRRYCITRLLREAQKSLESSPEGEFECYFVALKWAVTLKTDSLLSLRYDRTEIKGRHDRSFLRYADTWHLPSGRVAELKDFLSAKSRKEIVSQIVNFFETGDGTIKNLRPDHKKRARTCFSPRRFYLTERGVVLFYQPLMLQNDPDAVYEILL